MSGLGREDYIKVGIWLNKILLPYNYQVAPSAPHGKPAKNVRTMREYRLQLVDKHNDTRDELVSSLGNILSKDSNKLRSIKFNPISLNSSKFPSYTFTFQNQIFDLVIARGTNAGENFETQTIADLARAFSTSKMRPDFRMLVDQMNESNPDFASVEICHIKKRTGSTKKEGVPIELLGSVIADVILVDSLGNRWFVSIKDINGDTFSSYSGGSSLFDTTGTLQKNSAGATFLNTFGVDLNKVQSGFDTRNKKNVLREKIPKKAANSSNIKPIFERAWGMNYFYIKKLSTGWKVFWIDRLKLNSLSGSIVVSDISYPNTKSKSIVIHCNNGREKYIIEVRNSSGGEYPNDIKFKIK